MRSCLDVESRKDVVPAVRRFVASALEAWHYEAFADYATLVASELVTNAVLHAGTPITLSMWVHQGRLRVEVHDGDAQLPREVSAPCDATSGRGLCLVGALSSTWGAEPRGGGKVVWAELTRRPAS